MKAFQLLKERKYKELYFSVNRYIRRVHYSLWEYPALLRTMEHDTRFYVSNELLRKLLLYPVDHYAIETMKLSEAKSSNGWRGKIIPLNETETFAFIVNGDEKVYREYLRISYEFHGMSNIAPKIDSRVAGVPKTIEDITQYGYEITKGAVVVDDLNVVMDGLHRCSILYKLFGANHEIQVLRIYYRRHI